MHVTDHLNLSGDNYAHTSNTLLFSFVFLFYSVTVFYSEHAANAYEKKIGMKRL